jgi:capsid protein
VIDKRVSNLIGTGITPRPKTDDEALRKLLQELWDDWVDESDADERTDFYGQQALVARTVETSGECLSGYDRVAWTKDSRCLCSCRSWPEFVP